MHRVILKTIDGNVIKYLKEPGFFLFIKFFLQDIPQPVHYSVVAMVTTIISCVASVEQKEENQARENVVTFEINLYKE